MRLYWGRDTCAIGIHVLLEEAGQRYELAEVDVVERQGADVSSR